MSARQRAEKDKKGASREGSAFWRAPGAESALGALIYVGSGLVSVDGTGPEPALIDTQLAIDPRVKDCHGRWLDWEPSYSRCTPRGRAAYQCWLKTGRCDPEAAPGHVFLYLYGLERRAAHDAQTDPAARAELPVIQAELQRLMGIYGAHEALAQRAHALLEYLAAQALPPHSYLQAPIRREGELTFLEQVALGQCAQDRVPLPAPWALRWIEHSWALATPLAQRGSPQPRDRLEAYFAEVYQRSCGKGLKLVPGTQRLQLKYWPSSPTFDSTLKWVTVTTTLPHFRELPPELKVLARQLQEALEKGSLPERVEPPAPVETPPPVQERIIGVPVAQWPPDYRRALEELAALAHTAEVSEVRSDFLKSAFMQEDLLDRDRRQRLCEGLAERGVGVVPDPRLGDSLSGEARWWVFVHEQAATEEVTPHYRDALLRLQLAAAVVSMDGHIEAEYLPTLRQSIEEEEGLGAPERLRLKAHLCRLQEDAPRLSGLKRRLLKLTLRQQEQACDTLLKVLRLDGRGIHVNGLVLTQLIHALDLLGIGLAGAFARARKASRKEAPESRRGFRIPAAPTRTPTHVSLDLAKVEALQQEQKRVEALLAPVFAEIPPEEPASPPAVAAGGLLGLDPGASAFLRTLLGKPQWSRAELARLARERGLPLDGVLERLNEASYDHLEVPLFEEGEPLVLNPEALEKGDWACE